MAKYNIVKFKNMSPLHIGAGRNDAYDTAAPLLLSDTISSALASIFAQKNMGRGVKEFMESFTISSAFPYIGSTCYLPKPKGRLPFPGCNESLIRKKAKKVKYIEYSIWKDIVAGKSPDVDEKQFKGDFLVAKQWVNDFKEPYSTAVHQRVSVPRDSDGDAIPFFFEWKFFKKDAGLYCIIDAPTDIFEDLKTLFEQLGENGIGSDRSVGGGMFDVEFDTITLPDVAESNALMLLSQYIPTKEEISVLDLKNSSYDLVQRGGYMSGSSVEEFRHLLKSTVYMFNTSSVLKTQTAIKGCIVDVAPKWNDENMHSVYRSGRLLALPIKTVDYE